MICPILTAIEILDEATAILKESREIDVVASVIVDGQTKTLPGKRKDKTRLYALGPRIVTLRETTDCPRELVEAIDGLVSDIIMSRNVRWTMTVKLPRAIYSQEAMDKVHEMLGGP